ncbi:MAG: hypothetical protein IKI95_02315 [Clostridia bacterium]|nr:hypothetical protein [Clostridia bacterium]
MKDKSLGSILILNLILNTKGLKSLYDSSQLSRGEDTMFARLHPVDLYQRVLSDVDFDKLSESDKSKFLFLRPDKESEVDKKELHDYEMQFFAKEAHNRTAQSLATPKTNVVFCDFSKNKLMDPTNWVLYDCVNDNIYVNIDKDYSIARPSFLLENINGATRHHSIYQNILTALTNPNSLSDREYFLALSTAVKAYVYQDLRENNPEAYRIQLSADYSTPSNIEEVVFAFSQTRKDFQSAGIYGGKLREDLRRNEEIFHNYLQEELLTNSLVNLEDIFAYFDQSELNQSSGGMLNQILTHMVKGTAASFYNSLGADMQVGQTISDYVDALEKEMYDEAGLDIPSDEELDEFMGSEEYAEQEYLDALRQYQKEMGETTTPPTPEEIADEYAEEGEDDGKLDYRKMDSALPEEGKIDPVKVLPFHTYPNQNQDSAQ